MLLKSAQVTLFKSIEDSGDVPIDKEVTVLVGKNEAGKTAFLHALNKTHSIEAGVKFDVVDDYPRRYMTAYQNKQHSTNPAKVVKLTYQLEQGDIDTINTAYGFMLLDELTFTIEHKYDNKMTIDLSVNDVRAVTHFLNTAELREDTQKTVADAKTVKGLIGALERQSDNLGANELGFLQRLQARYQEALAAGWPSAVQYELYHKYLSPRRPKFLYFDDYYLLPGRVNLPQLQKRATGGTLQNEDKTILSLLRLADVDLETITETVRYEEERAKLEGISNAITDRVFQYWTQNPDLRVLIDIRPDAKAEPPYDNGNNLNIRIENLVHRVSVPFDQRSRGFIWFFSFLVWFDSITDELETDDKLILLLDEPGLSLHALGQADLLKYIDELSQAHQVLYTTHSPFMVQNERLYQARIVEDRPKEGTKISADLSGSDPSTLFPLQAALGYTIAQNLFISKRNLLVEGPADLVYLQFFSAMLERLGRTPLRDDVTVVPTGGLDKLVTFVALLRGNKLDMVVLHDEIGKPEARLEHLVREKILQRRQVFTYGLFRDPTQPLTATSTGVQPTDVEDLLSTKLYLSLFNAVYSNELPTPITEEGLPDGDRIVVRIERYLKSNTIKLRQSGGYNHYLPANHLAANPPADSEVDADTLQRFENLFTGINKLYR